jgi:hypothetical protein
MNWSVIFTGFVGALNTLFLMGHLNFAGYSMVIEIACITNIENSVCDNKGDM